MAILIFLRQALLALLLALLASQPGQALASNRLEKAEKAVARSPRNTAARAELGQAYLKAGRFASAQAAFEEAVSLGDTSPRTALGLSLAEIANRHERDAVAVLDQHKEALPAADLGLALALAGETGRGVAVLVDAVRVCSLGQITSALYEVGGQYHRSM